MNEAMKELAKDVGKMNRDQPKLLWTNQATHECGKQR
jgi:hypothetical protein